MAVPKTPSAINNLRGNPGKRAPNNAEPQFPSINPRPPAWLGKRAKEKWKERLKVLGSVPGLIGQGDYDSLAAYCAAFEELVAATEIVAKEGGTIISQKGHTIAHPAVGRKFKAMEILMKIGGKFGMNPSDRQSLTVGNVKDNDPLLEMMERRNLN